MTMTRKKALMEMMEASGRNVSRADMEGFAFAVWPDAKDHFKATYVSGAYVGSLDAAKALHEAALPGWIWGRYATGGMWVAKSPHTFRAPPMMEPSRGLLWCDIKALIAQEPDQ